MKQIFFILTFLSLLISLPQTACYYDNEVEQYGVILCDTINVSYSAEIKVILNANCISCHTPGGQQESSPFDTYDVLKQYADNRSLIDRVKATDSQQMPPPPAAPLSACDQSKIEAWINAGALNN